MAVLLSSPPPAEAYSVLTHEALIDVLWNVSIEPVLLKKFPASTPAQLKQAQAYCYAGAIIQDIGYYPFGSHLFSDLTHYVRSGDFVLSLLRQAQDLNEYAFAIGALAHYNADNAGHPISVNITVPEIYPKLRRKFGASVTYEEDPTAHVRTEFGLDVMQVARGIYPSQKYHDFIGFEVSKPLLERACQETYGLKLLDIFKTLDLSLGTYRWAVRSLIPEVTRAAWAAKKKEIQQHEPAMDLKKFRYNLSRASYERDFGKQYERPGIGAQILAFLIRFLPKVGPFKGLGFRLPPAEAELVFEKSFDTTVDRDKVDLTALSNGTLQLPNRDLDTGKPSKQGEYPLADKTYRELFERLAKEKVPVPAALQADYGKFTGPSESIASGLSAPARARE